MNAKKQPWQDRIVSFAELQKEKFPPMTYVVPDIVPEGVTILAGRPKIGKSWLALELCLGVASGTPVLGNIEPATGDVLYLALEDNPRRIHQQDNAFQTEILAKSHPALRSLKNEKVSGRYDGGREQAGRLGGIVMCGRLDDFCENQRASPSMAADRCAGRGTPMVRRRNLINDQWSPRRREMLESPAYRVLSQSAHRVLSRIELELCHHGGNDNGQLPVTFENFVEYGIDRASVAPALREGEALGFFQQVIGCAALRTVWCWSLRTATTTSLWQ
jgi:hypothetical protein